MRSSPAAYRAAEERLWASAGVTPHEEWHDLVGVAGRIRLQVVGDGPPVLFLHGVNTAAAVWAPLVRGLPNLRCLVLDRPGCGLSEPFGSPVEDVAGFARVAASTVIGVLDALDVPRATVVSTSLGGYYALRAAASAPERIAGVVELGWPVGASNGRLPLPMRLGGSRTLGRVTARLPAPRAAIRPMLRRIGLREAVAAGRVSDELVDWFHALLNVTPTMRNELDATPPFIHPIRGADPTIVIADDDLGRIRVPVHFLWGAEDPFGGPDVGAAFAAKVPGATFEIVPGAGHAPWVDDPALAAAVVRRHVTAWSAP